ncbi:inositol monophosphatase family protein [Commensalibacter communis]|uniref:inositol monophosphatase family protein n=1 Tax=Commensalibacter communis TaxID=2972786 RepID=UPI00232C5E3B|nr:inositol monophosphatase family protein [Commensalibacter communis]
MTRYGGECYAMAMLAAGHIDICVEYSLQPYDIIPLIPIIEHAGGVVITLDGSRPEQGGAVVAAANLELHQQVLHLLNTER